MEKWLIKVISEAKAQAKEDAKKAQEEPSKVSFQIGTGEQKFGLDIDVLEWVEKLAFPGHLIERALTGFDNLLSALPLEIKREQRVTGYSNSIYEIPYLLEDDTRQVIFVPALYTSFAEALGLPKPYSYNMFAPFLCVEFVKFLDILNGHKKPTILAFYGLKGLQTISGVNLFDLLREAVKAQGFEPTKEGMENGLKEKRLFDVNLSSLLQVYGIPRIDLRLKDTLRMSTLDPRLPSDKRILHKMGIGTGILDFLNPSIVDYSLFTARKAMVATERDIAAMVSSGVKVGHAPSTSPQLPSLSFGDVIREPLLLVRELGRQNMVTELKTGFELTEHGLKIVRAEVYGKPKESALNKVWNVVKRIQEITPFLKFVWPHSA
jgi:hypothetical protein